MIPHTSTAWSSSSPTIYVTKNRLAGHKANCLRKLEGRLQQISALRRPKKQDARNGNHFYSNPYKYPNGQCGLLGYSQMFLFPAWDFFLIYKECDYPLVWKLDILALRCFRRDILGSLYYYYWQQFLNLLFSSAVVVVFFAACPRSHMLRSTLTCQMRYIFGMCVVCSARRDPWYQIIPGFISPENLVGYGNEWNTSFLMF